MHKLLEDKEIIIIIICKITSLFKVSIKTLPLLAIGALCLDAAECRISLEVRKEVRKGCREGEWEQGKTKQWKKWPMSSDSF